MIRHPNLKLWLPMNTVAAGTTPDDSGVGKTGTLVASPTQVAGITGSALSFNGTTQKVTFANYTGLPVTNLTYSAWVKPSGTTYRSVIAGDVNSVAGCPNWRIENDNRVLFFKQGVAVIGYSSTSIPNGAWTHIALTYTSAGVFTHYINGVASGSGTLLLTLNTPTSLLVGAEKTNGIESSYFNGAMDDVHIYDVVLSVNDIKRLANGFHLLRRS